jgi:YggT family protein
VTTISVLGTLLVWALTIYLLLLVARMVITLVQQLSRSFQAAGLLAVVFEVVFSATDPPLRVLGRYIPPLRVGTVAFDLGFLLLFIVILVLRRYAQDLG